MKIDRSHERIYNNEATEETRRISVENILETRGSQYGKSWLTTTYGLQELIENDMDKLRPLIMSGLFHNWFQILGKLARALASPTCKDHWVDIAGYATLVIKHLEATESDREF